MSDEQLIQPAGPSKTIHDYLPLIICTLITAIITSGGTYYFLSEKSAVSEANLQQEIKDLKKSNKEELMSREAEIKKLQEEAIPSDNCLSSPITEADQLEKGSNLKNTTEQKPVSTNDYKNAAEKALLDFFYLLRTKEFSKAVDQLEIPQTGETVVSKETNYYTETWEGLESFSPQEDRNDKAKVLENYSHYKKESTYQPEIISSNELDNDTYEIKVRFLEENDKIHEQGPCCGMSGEPQSEFTYFVKKINESYKVITAPHHVP